jgi:lytic murein transglycosylase B
MIQYLKWLLLVTWVWSLCGHGAELTPAIDSRLQALSQQLDVPMPQLELAVRMARYRQSVLDAITRPWEAKPWYLYRPLFVTQERIEHGVQFWRLHANVLDAAEKKWQVPASIIVAIIGIETRYGTQMGNHPVLDSLYTLGFHFPERSDYFSKEFAQYVKLARSQGWPLRNVMGSYAGAMGMGQFMPTSYLHFAIDGNQDGHKDLFYTPDDAIHSVAHYFAEHGWQSGAPVAYPAKVENESQISQLLDDKMELTHCWQELSRQGVSIATDLTATTPVKLLRLEQAQGNEYWVVGSNFQAITRYNRSPLYAMAVYQLSEALTSAYDEVK